MNWIGTEDACLSCGPWLQPLDKSLGETAEASITGHTGAHFNLNYLLGQNSNELQVNSMECKNSESTSLPAGSFFIQISC